MQEVNGDQRVLIEFPALSSDPTEIIVRVVASRTPGSQGEGSYVAINDVNMVMMMMVVVPIPTGDVGLMFDGDSGAKWQYEEVTVTTPDGLIVDLTRMVEKGGSASPRSITIDAPSYTVREEGKEEEHYDDRGGRRGGGRSSRRHHHHR